MLRTIQAWRRVALVFGLVSLLALALDCSSQSSLVGQGACEGYCFKIVGAKCKTSPTREHVTQVTACLSR